MQYIMKPAININTYEVALFDTAKDNVNLNSVRDITTLSSVLQEARAFVGTGPYLNPVRGKSADGKYYLTFLRYAQYGYSNTNDTRAIGQLFAASPSTSSFSSLWTSAQKADGTLQTDYSWQSRYNVHAPVPSKFNGNQAVSLVLPKMKIYNSWSGSYDITFISTYAQNIRPGVQNSNITTNAAQPAFNLPSRTTSDWIFPQAQVSLLYTQHLNLISSNTINTQNYIYIYQDDSYKNDGLSYLKDFGASTFIADMPAEEVKIDAGLIWLDNNRMMKLSDSDWSSRDAFLPGTRPKFLLDRVVKSIGL